MGDTTSGLTEGLLDDGLLNVNVDLSLDADIAAPIAGAVAANANAAAPIDASVSANIASFDSASTAIAERRLVGPALPKPSGAYERDAETVATVSALRQSLEGWPLLRH